MISNEKRIDFHQRRGVSLNPLRPLLNLKNRGFMTWDTEVKDGLKGKELFCWSLTKRTKNPNVFQTLQIRENNSHKWVLKSVKYDIITKQIKERYTKAKFKTAFEKLFKEIDNHKDKTHKRIIFVHNLGFDARFIIDYCVKVDIKYNALVSGSNMIALTIPDLGVQFRDSYQFLLGSQHDCEIEWNVDKILRKIDCTDLFQKDFNKWSEEDKERCIRHNANDTNALMQIMINYRNTMYDIAKVDMLTTNSLASLSMKAFRITQEKPIPNPFVFLKFDKELGRMSYDYEKKEEKFVRKSYFGGRTEVFEMNRHKKANYIDRVSHYPAEMYYNKFPIGFGAWSDDKELLMEMIKGKCSYEGFIECIVKPNKEATKYPILPFRMDKKIMFTNCSRKWVYALPELKLAYEFGYEITPIKGFIFETSEFIFKPFVKKFMKVKKNNKGGKRKGAKILMNSEYGKFGQAFERKSPIMHYFTTDREVLDFQRDHISTHKMKITKNEEGLWIAVEIVDNTTIKAFMNVCIASYVVAYARVSLWKEIHEMELLDIDVLYSDTDSLTIEDKDTSAIELGKELGCWDIEQTFEEVKFLAPKCYISIKKDKKGKEHPYLKMKGIDKHKINEICEIVEQFDRNKWMDMIELLIREPIELAERYMTYNQAHRCGIILGTKQLSKHYSFENYKRKFVNGKSIAWNNETLPTKFWNGIDTTFDEKIRICV